MRHPKRDMTHRLKTTSLDSGFKQNKRIFMLFVFFSKEKNNLQHMKKKLLECIENWHALHENSFWGFDKFYLRVLNISEL